MAKPVDAISHWDQLFENFQASSLEFYDLRSGDRMGVTRGGDGSYDMRALCVRHAGN